VLPRRPDQYQGDQESPYNPLRLKDWGIGYEYGTAQVLFNAIEKAGTLDPDAVREALLKTDIKMTMHGRATFEKGTQFWRWPVAWASGRRPINHGNFDKFLYLIDKLAEYEKLTPPDEKARIRLRKDGLSKIPKYEACIAKIDDKYIGYMGLPEEELEWQLETLRRIR
jgi:hypothetical protein